MIRAWHELTAKQIATLDRQRTVVLVMCSPLEVHGPHLPVMADLREAEGLTELSAERLVKKHPEIAFVRLPWMFTAADVLPHPGSIKFSPKTVARVIEELGTSLGRQGFRHVWIGSFHGGPRHVVALEVGAHRAWKATGVEMISIFSLLVKKLTGGSSDLADFLGGIGGISKEELKGDSHGGLVETSILLHLAGTHVDPEHVSLPPRSMEIERAERGLPPAQKGPRATFLEILRSFPMKQRYYERETYAGAPARATAELGEKYLDRLADAAVEALSARYSGAISVEQCRSPLWPLRHVMMSRALGAAFERLVATKESPV
jgi:creatinine amidohydrolase/Fe(II)-dependent formamide hydrolase-like protein